MEHFGLALFWYGFAYIIVTGIGIGHTIFNILVLHRKSMKDSPGMGEGYEKTKPWHPLYNLLIFPLFAFFYFQNFDTITLSLVVQTSILWGFITIVVDLFGWVLIKHPWSLTFKEFYLDYQPWITLIYITIFVSPFLAYGFIVLF